MLNATGWTLDTLNTYWSKQFRGFIEDLGSGTYRVRERFRQFLNWRKFLALVTQVLTEEEHPLQALALDRQNKPFDVSVQIRRTVRQPNDICSGVLEQVAKLRGELLVAVQDEPSLAAQKAIERVSEIPTDLHYERAVRSGSDSSNVHFSRRQLDDDEHIVGHEPANRGDLDGEEVGRSNGFPMGGEKRAPWRPLTSLRCGLDAVFSQNAGDGAPGYRMAEIQQGAANSCIPCPVPKLGPFEIDHKSTA